jgi:hypothetical protein
MADESPIETSIADVEMYEPEVTNVPEGVPKHADIEPEIETRKTFLE